MNLIDFALVLSFFIGFVSFVRVIIQAWECSAGKELTWNLLSLFTSSGMLFLEVSLLAFLLQGNNASGVEALTRTFGISGIIVGFDVLLKVILLFLLEILFSLWWLCMNSLIFSLLGYLSVCIWGPIVHRH